MRKLVFLLVVIAALSVTYSCNSKSADSNSNDKDTTATIQEPQLGAWEIESYVDEYGDPTSKKYAIIECQGSFSNSATTGSNCSAYFVVDTSDVRLRISEYGNHDIKADYEMMYLKVKEPSNKETEFSAFIQNDGYITFYDSRNYEDVPNVDTLRTILMRGGELKFSGRRVRYTESTYSFSVNADHLDNAMEKLK